MASSFMGLYVQREALVAAQKSLDITGNNLTNINTPGYSRQRVDVCSVGNIGYNLLYNTSVSLSGQGVDTVGVAQYRDALVDEKVRNYTTLYNEYSVKDTVMKDVETALDNIESDTYGFAANLAEFKAALQSFSSDEANRKEIANVVFREAESVVQQIQYMNNRLTDISKQTLGDADISVDRINAILENIASLNKQITTSYVQMGYIEMSAGNYQVDNDYGPLELKDNINSLIDELSQYGSVSVEEKANGSYTVSFAGQVVVHNDQYSQIAMTKDNPDPLEMGFVVMDAGKYIEDDDRYDGLMNAEQWQDQQTKKEMTCEELVRYYDSVDITNKLTSGSLKGYLDVYNGEGSYAEEGGNTFQGIEYYRDMLNAFTVTMTNAFNDIYKDFTDEKGDSLKLFSYGEMEYYQKVEITEAEFSNAADPDSVYSVTDDNGTVSYYQKVQLTDIPVKTAEEQFNELAAADPVNYGVDADGNYYQKISDTEYRDAINAGADDVYSVTNNGVTTYYRKLSLTDIPGKTALEQYNELYAQDPDSVYAIEGEGDFRTAAANASVTQAWRGNPSLLAQPEQFPDNPEDVMDELNNDFIHKCLAIFENSGLSYDVDGKGELLKMNLEDFVAHISDTLGTQVESNGKILETTDIMLDSVQDARDEIMGVSIDEEGVNMLNYQKWYNAIARMVTTLDEALDKIINGMGVVGL